MKTAPLGSGSAQLSAFSLPQGGPRGCCKVALGQAPWTFAVMTSAPRIAPPGSTEELRTAVQEHRAALDARIAAGEDGTALGQRNARFLEEHFRARFAVAVETVGKAPTGVALAAVGSFGRGAVALRSDADVVLVVNPKILNSDAAAKFAEALLYPMWDATFAVGHQVLSSADALPLAQSDLATATELLDMRFLAGDESLVRDLVASASEGLFGEEDLRPIHRTNRD